MMNEGAGDLDTTAYGARMEDLNMEFAAASGRTGPRCGMTTLKETADESFDMLRLALPQPRFDEEPIERAKRELSVDLMQAETDPKTHRPAP